MNHLPRVQLEVCVGSVEDALTASVNGADRLELCAALGVGGLTPSLGMLVEVKQAVALPVMVLIRPRAGGFVYTDAEWRVVRRDIDLALAHGAEGIVCGVLQANGTVDRVRCGELVQAIGPAAIVFHRAFDVTSEPFVALEHLIDLGFQRLMTSGQALTAVEGAAMLAELRNRAAGRIEILPAGGIHAATAAQLLAQTGCDQVHASLRGSHIERVRGLTGLAFGRQEATDGPAVRLLRRVLDTCP